MREATDGPGGGATGYSVPSGAPWVIGLDGSMTTTDAAAAPDWEKRFRAPRVSLPDWAEDAPDRSLFVSNATGTYELYAWDRASGRQRQVTDRPNGTTDGVLTPDGEAVWWFSDTDGDGSCPYLRTPVQSYQASAALLVR